MFTKYKYFLFSENPDKLVKFYTDVLGMKITNKLELPKDYGYALEVAPDWSIWLAQHSEVKGYNKDPYRHFINLYTDEVQDYFEKVKNVPGVKILQEPTPMSNFNPEETRYVCTILDPEGNCLQFMGKLKNK